MAMPIAGQNGVVMLSIEIVDDEMINAFTQEIKKVDGYQEECRLKQYLLENYPAGSDRKIRREELLNLIA
ncbi:MULTISPECIES: hypothetical protein [Thermoactinomyces]|jgi:hypothetical protein|uniref:Uncharacterized protein n=1 Tax=Thermoactinomyces vulgaris TaxID=2026 RepID=A0ABS0QF68_THEVU|nr:MULTISPECIES: hypothetical protein [Thermoactinomyces]KFZ41388.1 hypothetical protein JS81_01800 [Thermoactinomyces sp. Gus2-1]KYQ87429.1 hypothetical protein AYX07_01625 [Thermoactinomyces sp. AS95]MBA4551420.1 hypothetical protein [Thermoactinomyces vulgaris]MBA4595370.1 hypothetical protein [Thermoactinomyces vulgaris]MBH8585360.1 hypothetical protein [Thermoactinomyces sp. CICC 10520]